MSDKKEKTVDTVLAEAFMQHVKVQSRRNFIASGVKGAGFLGMTGIGSQVFPQYGFSAAEDIVVGDTKPFVLYVHLGSTCGISAGLVQPEAKGKWQKGFFARGNEGGSNNPHINSHYQEGSLIFHEYNKSLREVADDLCLLNGTPISLDHNVARVLAQSGAEADGVSPEWALAVTQHAKTKANPNPICISNAQKTLSTKDVALLDANSMATFSTLTSDVGSVPKGDFSSLVEVYKNRVQVKGLGSTMLTKADGEGNSYNLETLINGLPALKGSETLTKELEAALSDQKFRDLIKDNPDAPNMRPDRNFRNQLVLAAVLASKGIANGMTIKGGGQDLHNGGADVASARFAGIRWAYLTLLWKWIKAKNMDKDTTIIVSHEFGRTPYNDNAANQRIKDKNGANKDISIPGRDHGLNMGMMFFNANVPSKARVGNIADNLTAVAGIDTKGGFDPSLRAANSADMVGSMLMRIYPNLFPTERIVRKHWNNFKELDPVLEA